MFDVPGHLAQMLQIKKIGVNADLFRTRLANTIVNVRLHTMLKNSNKKTVMDVFTVRVEGKGDKI